MKNMPNLASIVFSLEFYHNLKPIHPHITKSKMGKSAFLRMFKINWTIRYNPIPINLWGLTSVNFGNKLNCHGFNIQKKSFTTQFLFNYVIQPTINYNENADQENEKCIM